MLDLEVEKSSDEDEHRHHLNYWQLDSVSLLQPYFIKRYNVNNWLFKSREAKTNYYTYFFADRVSCDNLPAKTNSIIAIPCTECIGDAIRDNLQYQQHNMRLHAQCYFEYQLPPHTMPINYQTIFKDILDNTDYHTDLTNR